MVVTKIELKRSAFLSFIMMLILIITGGAIWSTADSMGILESNTIWYYAVVVLQLVIIWFAFLFSLVFFGCIVELQGREPGIITIGISYIPPVLYMYALGVLTRFGYLFALLSIFAVLYVLYSK